MASGTQTLRNPLPEGTADALKAAAFIAALTLFGAGLAVAAPRIPIDSTPLLALGGVMFLGLLALTVLRFHWAVALGVFLLGVVQVEPAPPDLVFGLILLIALVTGRFDLTRVPLAVMLTLGAFIGLNVLSAVNMVDPARAAFFFAITLYLAVFSVWLAGYLDSMDKARVFVLAYLAIACLSAALALLAVFTAFPLHDVLTHRGDRGRALFKDANVYGPFLIPIMLVVLEELIRPRLLMFSGAIKVAIVALLTGGILVSYSRAAWISLVLGVIVLLGIHAMREGGGRRVAIIGSVFFGGAALCLGILALSGGLGFLEQRATLQDYDTDRFASQRAGIQLAERNPLGYGPGQFDPLNPIAAHSTYVRVLAEQGVLGVAVFSFLLIVTLGFAIKNAFDGRSTFGIGSAALLASWVSLLLNSSVVDTLHWRHLWVIAALIWVASMHASSSGSSSNASTLEA